MHSRRANLRSRLLTHVEALLNLGDKGVDTRKRYHHTERDHQGLGKVQFEITILNTSRHNWFDLDGGGTDVNFSGLDMKQQIWVAPTKRLENCQTFYNKTFGKLPKHSISKHLVNFQNICYRNIHTKF